MRQARLYKSSRITLLGYLVSQSEYSLLNPYFSTDTPARDLGQEVPVLRAICLARSISPRYKGQRKISLRRDLWGVDSVAWEAGVGQHLCWVRPWTGGYRACGSRGLGAGCGGWVLGCVDGGGVESGIQKIPPAIVPSLLWGNFRGWGRIDLFERVPMGERLG
jgi:hypothetical protein